MNNIDEAYRLTLTLRESGAEQRIYLDGNTVRQTINIPEPEVQVPQIDIQKPIEPAGTVRPGAMQGEMRAIPQTQLERSLQTLGKSLEIAGQMVDKAAPGSINDLLEELRIKAKVPVIGDLRLRDVIPFIGGTEEVEGPGGQMGTKEVGTPQALQMAGRGESLTTGTGLTTQMKPDVKAATLDVGLTAAPFVKPIGQAVVKAAKATKDLPVGLSIKGVEPIADDARSLIAGFIDKTKIDQSGKVKLNSPIRLKGGHTLSGFEDADQKLFYGRDKNGVPFNIPREYVNPDDFVSSRDGNKTMEKIKAGLIESRKAVEK